MYGKKFDPKPMSASDALQYAIRALSARSLTEYELEKKLKLRKTSPEIISNILTRLRELGFLNDSAIAARVSEDPNLGKFGVQRKLSKRGIHKHVIEDTLITRDADTDLSTAVALLEKYQMRFTGERRQQKAIAFFMRRGFSYQVIHKALEQFELEVPDEPDN
jgi:regulatory protein